MRAGDCSVIYGSIQCTTMVLTIADRWIENNNKKKIGFCGKQILQQKKYTSLLAALKA